MYVAVRPEVDTRDTARAADRGEVSGSGRVGAVGERVVVMSLFNSVLGEELLFRGVLLPRMNGAFGDRDWVVNGVIFSAYHLHMPWSIPSNLMDTFLLSYPSKRYRSAWIGIAVHSAQSVFVVIAVAMLVI